MRIATIPIGYADGYPRALSNKGAVLIEGNAVLSWGVSVWISLWRLLMIP